LRIPSVSSKIVTYSDIKNTVRCTDDADDWYKALELMIVETRTRRELADAVYREVKKNFNVVDQAKPLVRFLTSI